MCSSDIFLGLLAILFPPIAVWIKSGICTADSLINILLCTLGWLPGLLHAWYIISLYPESNEYDYATLDPERVPVGEGPQNSRVTYYYVNRSEGEGLNAQGRPVVYGTVGGVPAQAPRPPVQAPRPHQPPRAIPQTNAGEGRSGSEAVPPSYDQAVAGDNKVQR